MEEVSVWIPTYKRPAMLRTALRSVASQTAVKSIREVVVIENGLDERSREVCAEFGELPITYSCREKSLPPGSRENTEAYKKTLGEFKTRLVALLFDDDWWAPGHLASALESFTVVPDCVASFCTCMWTAGESGFLIGLLGDFIPWFAAGGRRTANRWVLAFPDLVVASQIATAFHYSSMTIDREVYLSCVEAIGHENPFDTDRLLSIELGFHGKVVCDPMPNVFVRVHATTESARLEQTGEARLWFRRSTDQIVERARQKGLNLGDEFAARLQSTGASFDSLRDSSHLQNIDYLVQKGIIARPRSQNLKPWSRVKNAARGIVPPLLYRGITRLLRQASVLLVILSLVKKGS